MLIQAIQNYAETVPNNIAIRGINSSLTYKALLSEIDQAQEKLNEFITNSTVAIAMDNSPAWAVLDLVALKSKTPLVPIPSFFSDTQTAHTIEDAGASVLITDNPQRLTGTFSDSTDQKFTITVAGKRLMVLRLKTAAKNLDATIVKITYTSGTTGQPKGVCLSEKAMFSVAESVGKMVELDAGDHHLCVLPLSTLLENVAGLYATLLAGGTSHILPSKTVGLNGSALDVDHLHQALITSQATTAIFIPELLSALVSAYEAGYSKLEALRFLAVGGASVSPDLLVRANQVGLPAFEGYGLSESASVVALNTSAGNKIGSVGKPLPHLKVKVSDGSEILVKGANYLGYTAEKSLNQDWLNTGDIGYLDDEGYLFINGRKKNIFITSFGRNVSPEWVERDMTSTPEILQACLFGEAKPWNTALVFAKLDITEEMINRAISRINQQLPDYARVGQWLSVSKPFSIQNNQLTPNGRLKRDEIWQAYQARINALYKNPINNVLENQG